MNRTILRRAAWPAVASACLAASLCVTPAASSLRAADPTEEPVKLIFDTDIGNDIDDALALGMIHALANREEVELLAVTITKDHEQAAAYTDLVNTFYGRPDIPIGVVRDGVTPAQSRFTVLAAEPGTDDTGQLYPHDLTSGKDAPDAVGLLRQVLAAQPDRSVAIAQVGFSTNLARLLDSEPDDVSPLSGKELAAQKVYLLSAMFGGFEPLEGRTHLEYNVVKDLPAARKLVAEWPTPIVFSGYEVGLAIRFPAASIEQDFDYVEHHPLPEAYQLYQPTPHERPTWDLTSVLYAVRPDRGYFDVSPAGTVTVTEKGATSFRADPRGLHRYLIASPEQRAVVREVQALLASEPPQPPAAEAKP